jgi:hypothetical protein
MMAVALRKSKPKWLYLMRDGRNNLHSRHARLHDGMNVVADREDALPRRDRCETLNT